jgi:hypothetical protein
MIVVSEKLADLYIYRGKRVKTRLPRLRGHALVSHTLHSPSFPSCVNKIDAIHPFSRALRVKGGCRKARFSATLIK